MDLGGDPINVGQWITSYEDNWDPRNVYEAQLDGIPLPPERIPGIDSHLYVLPEGYKAPTSNTSGRSWLEYGGTIGLEFGPRRNPANELFSNRPVIGTNESMFPEPE